MQTLQQFIVRLTLMNISSHLKCHGFDFVCGVILKHIYIIKQLNFTGNFFLTDSQHRLLN